MKNQTSKSSKPSSVPAVKPTINFDATPMTDEELETMISSGFSQPKRAAISPDMKIQDRGRRPRMATAYWGSDVAAAFAENSP